MAFKKGNLYKHKDGCTCFRCSGTAWNKGMKGYLAGEKHWKWQDKNPSYRAIHGWLVKNFGKASHCDFNNLHQAKRYEWANISDSYLRDRDDYAQLCSTCHNEYDWIRRGKPLYRKGGRSIRV